MPYSLAYAELLLLEFLCIFGIRGWMFSVWELPLPLTFTLLPSCVLLGFVTVPVSVFRQFVTQSLKTVVCSSGSGECAVVSMHAREGGLPTCFMPSEWSVPEMYRCALAGSRCTEWIREPELARLQSKLLKVKTLALCKPNPKNVLATSTVSYQAHSRAVVVFAGWR